MSNEKRTELINEAKTIKNGVLPHQYHRQKIAK